MVVEALGLEVFADLLVVLGQDGVAQLLEEVADGDGLLGRPVLREIEEGHGSLLGC